MLSLTLKEIQELNMSISKETDTVLKVIVALIMLFIGNFVRGVASDSKELDKRVRELEIASSVRETELKVINNNIVKIDRKVLDNTKVLNENSRKLDILVMKSEGGS